MRKHCEPYAYGPAEVGVSYEVGIYNERHCDGHQLEIALFAAQAKIEYPQAAKDQAAKERARADIV